MRVSSSYGMVLLPDETDDMTLGLKLADERLYADKGRHQSAPMTIAG